MKCEAKYYLIACNAFQYKVSVQNRCSFLWLTILLFYKNNLFCIDFIVMIIAFTQAKQKN